MTPTQRQLFGEVDRLRDFLRNARIVVATTPLQIADYHPLARIFGTNNVREQINGALDSFADRIDDLEEDGAVGKRLVAGTTTPVAFAALVDEVGKGIAYILKDVDETNYGGASLWNQVALPTLTEAEVVASNALDRGQSIGTIIAVVAVALAVVYVTSQVSR